MLGIDAGEKYDMAILISRAKRRLPKNAPRALVIMEHDAIVQNDEQATFSSDDESEASMHNIVLDEYEITAGV